jgi:hypothetical protein
VNLGPLFFWPFLANLLAAIVVGIVFAASRRIVRWTTSRFPKSLDADRVKEELEAMLNEMSATERVKLAASLLADSRALRQELAERAAASRILESAHTDSAAASRAITPGPPVAMKLTLTFGTPVPKDEVPKDRA